MNFLSRWRDGVAALIIATGLCLVLIACTRESATADHAGQPSSHKTQDKLAPELRALYQAWTTTGASGPAQAQLPNVMVVDNRVAIEASAETDAAALKAALEKMGMQRGEQFGRQVSGQIPISALDQAASLPELHYAWASRAIRQAAPAKSAEPYGQ